ncbi:MAG: NRDE family protein [Verrucomicrobia bacterium]|nr:NRDE family protein [Verrucomicrobiota bacterium]
MCTVTWWRDAATYSVFFNRDEKRTRRLATPPAVLRRDGVQYVAPRDDSRGGTWLAVNAFGLTLGTLNLYPDPPPGFAPRRSRGLLVRDLITSHRLAEVGSRLRRADLTEFSPFTIVALAPDAKVYAWAWDGDRLTQDAEPSQPLSSSSFATVDVLASRRVLYARMRADAGTTEGMLDAYHGSHQPERGAYAVCMHRPDARTVSYSRVRVSPDVAEFRYHAGPPCADTPDVSVTLALLKGRAS